MINENIETSLNITDYPEPKEQKRFVFKVDASCKGEITIFANNLEEANQRFNFNDYDYLEYDDYEIESVRGVSNE